MKKSLQTFILLLMALIVPVTATAAYNQLADGVYMDGTTLYITSGVTSLGNLQVNPSEIYCYATIPPACVSNTFTGYDATLHVPAAGMVSYFTTLYWYNFNNILSDAIEPQSVTMNASEAEVEVDNQLSLSATVAPSDATPKTVYWSSSDPSVAIVSDDGTVTALTFGECDIFARCIDKVAVCHVTVVPPRIIITLDKHEARLLPNHTMTLTATCSPIDVDLAVTSSNPGVAIPRLVNGTIMVVGVAEGTATITVNAADGWGNPDSCEVTVYTDHGDVNSDGYVNISDVTALIDYLLSGNPSGVNLTGADCNNDNNINISDVTTLIDYLLSGTWPWEPDEPVKETFTVNGVSFKMVAVEGGTFMMGATAEQNSFDNEDNRPAHEVTLSSYYIGETEVTQALWQAVMGNNPSNFTGDLQCPVEMVSWNDCKTFIIKLKQLTGKNFRLPTEAEWEYAARGGNRSQGYMYSGSNNIYEVAWYKNNSNSTTHPVASIAPNELGLYDMSGNVWEWVNDRYGIYSSGAQTNPTGSESGSSRVVRGGSWLNEDYCCRASYRSNYWPSSTRDHIGMRLVLGPDISEQHEYIDLGLPSGTLWATCNVGASAPEEYGDYFVWGETEPKSNDGNVTSLAKYSLENRYSTVNIITELSPEEDAAFVNWGSSWRMPSIEQLQELQNICTWKWTSINGVKGRLVTGPNGNSLFLPAAGANRTSGSLVNVGMYGYYNSREYSSSGPYGMCYLYFNENIVSWSYYTLEYFHSVRAVRISQN